MNWNVIISKCSVSLDNSLSKWTGKKRFPWKTELHNVRVAFPPMLISVVLLSTLIDYSLYSLSLSTPTSTCSYSVSSALEIPSRLKIQYYQLHKRPRLCSCYRPTLQNSVLSTWCTVESSWSYAGNGYGNWCEEDLPTVGGSVPWPGDSGLRKSRGTEFNTSVH